MFSNWWNHFRRFSIVFETISTHHFQNIPICTRITSNRLYMENCINYSFYTEWTTTTTNYLQSHLMTFQLFTRVQIIQYTIHWDEKERDKLWFKKLYNGNIYSKMKWIELLGFYLYQQFNIKVLLNTWIALSSNHYLSYNFYLFIFHSIQIYWFFFVSLCISFVTTYISFS